MDIGRATTRAHPPHPLPARPYYTIQRIGPPRPCIVGAGEDVDVGMGPLWLPVRAHHIYSPYLECIAHKGMPLHFVVSLYQCTVYFLVHCPLWRGDMSSRLSVITIFVQTVWRATR